MELPPTQELYAHVGTACLSDDGGAGNNNARGGRSTTAWSSRRVVRLGAASLLLGGLAVAIVHSRSLRGDDRGTVESDALDSLVEEFSDACHTAKEGENCHYNVMWFMTEGFKTHPEWIMFKGLSKDSSFEDFQQAFHDNRPKTCPQPCTKAYLAKQKAPKSAEASPAPSGDADDSGDAECHLAEKGEKCYEHVLQAMESDIKQNPDAYEGLPDNPTFVKVQEFLHKSPSLKKPCPMPCDPLVNFCHKPAKGEPCQTAVEWVMSTGIDEEPAKYKGLTKSSTADEVQAFINEHEYGKCPKPCPADHECHTTKEGEKCFESVNWVMKTGIKKHPLWFKDLNEDSILEEVQAHINWDPKATTKCPLPC